MLLVDAGGQCWGLPLARVTTSLVFEASAVETGAEGLRVDWSGAHLPLFDLGALLERRSSEAPTRAFTGIVHASVQGPFVVVVDRIVGQQEAVLRTLGPLLECIDGLMGVTLDAQGVPIFLLDLPRVLSRPVDPPRGTG
jgi:two-component system chemotaxis sensor kinase CheA